MDEAEIYVLTDPEGIEHEFTELFSFDSEDYNKSYIILAPVADMDNEEVGLLAFTQSDETDELFPVETEEELAMVEEVMNTIFDDPRLA